MHGPESGLDRPRGRAIFRHLQFWIAIRRAREGGGDCLPGAYGRGRGSWPLAIGRSAFVTEEMGLMRRTSLGWSGLLAAILALVPSWVQAQTGYLGYAP